ncbi:hypothetical protein I8H89_00430 [Candidatus Saccharibacteria bacterium]|nr:hypothetical protein [Candidatus Saccharibacteria bacterium]
MIVTKKLAYGQKVVLFYDLASRVISYAGLDMRAELKKLRKELIYMAEIRNVVAHAKWLSITKGAYVRSQVETDRAGRELIRGVRISKVVLTF